jgi:dCTP deaminase
MILTQRRICDEVQNGNIILDPFCVGQLNPNSYNYRLAPVIARRTGEGDTTNIQWEELTVGPEGFLLEPRRLYLGLTEEIIGSRRYTTTLLGRSSIGRLGLFLNVTADLGHVGSASRWTLELKVVQPLRIYPRMLIGQVAFWGNRGASIDYCGRYNGDLHWASSRDGSLGA